ncbi:carotenoid biosynthesis protein [Roseivirga sp.]|uniref:carotenoid biosynthesis protein n=1 Tax=Roseivirga sp. TaxID=1964215 RepID=UPI002B276561|nr:carotenoid biosynthesis protein [Roseivirga sp.]
MLKQLLSTGKRNQRIAFILLIAMHTAGILGLFFEESRAIFQSLTPFNLLLTAAIIFHFEVDKSTKYFIFIIFTFLFGFFIEVAGVKTGAIFGEYTYGPTLGFKLFDVPLIIGLNWAILIYITGIASNKLSSNFWVRCIYGAIMMVFIDVLIEPVAIRLDFWQWVGSSIPTQNYLSWFLIAFLLHIVFQELDFSKNNPLAIKLLIIEMAFFVSLNLI